MSPHSLQPQDHATRRQREGQMKEGQWALLQEMWRGTSFKHTGLPKQTSCPGGPASHNLFPGCSQLERDLDRDRYLDLKAAQTEQKREISKKKDTKPCHIETCEHLPWAQTSNIKDTSHAQTDSIIKCPWRNSGENAGIGVCMIKILSLFLYVWNVSQ